MSSAMDKALMDMSLEEEDLPFDMPDLPEFSSCEKNMLSVVGRILNPECQKMAYLILDMPRKWQKYDKVRGIALSKERFQFIFQSEHDLIDTLEKGIYSVNEWALVIERWVEHPPDDFLQFVHIWVQISNIPVNHRTEAAITALGDLVGQVVELAFDPLKVQSQSFVRVYIKFDVSKSLRRSKVVNLPRGGQTTVSYLYERVQKRCYTCQRLTHDQSVCPLLVKLREDKALAKRRGIPVEKRQKALVLKENDPLFGVMSEIQVGINPNTGRPRIAKEVLEGMRQYLMVANRDERMIREDRVKNSLLAMENDPIAQKLL